MTEIYLHLGAHKTGSTYFQRCLRKSSAFFAAQDSVLVSPSDVMDDVIPDVVKWRRNPTEVPRPESLALFLERIKRRPTRSVLWSYEGLLGEMNLHLDGALYPHAPLIVDALGESLRGTPTKVAFTVRSYPGFIESAYKWLVRNSQAFSFERFMSNIDIDRLTWGPAVESLRSTFGEENVLVTTYEEYRTDSPAGNHRMLRHFFGADVDLSQFSDHDTRSNPAPNRKALEFARLVHEAVRRSDVFSRDDVRYLNKRLVPFINREFTDDFDPEPAQLMAPDLKDELHARYVRECADLRLPLPG